MQILSGVIKNIISTSLFIQTLFSSKNLKMLYQNSDIETSLRVQVLDVHKESKKTRYTSLVIRHFEGFLCASSTCVIIFFDRSKHISWLFNEDKA